MQLIGMLDSPYVRRTAISLQFLGLTFEHRPLSVFRDLEEFRQINPLVKAPTLVCDDGELLIDSTLIIDYAQALSSNGRMLMPSGLPERRQALRLIGLALTACEKSVQLVYERQLRPEDKQHEPWRERLQGQLLAACSALEAAVSAHRPDASRENMDQAGISAAVAWRFARETLPQALEPSNHPALDGFSLEAERLPEFLSAPFGTGAMQTSSAAMAVPHPDEYR